jgi:hypothetical protein
LSTVLCTPPPHPLHKVSISAAVDALLAPAFARFERFQRRPTHHSDAAPLPSPPMPPSSSSLVCDAAVFNAALSYCGVGLAGQASAAGVLTRMLAFLTHQGPMPVGEGAARAFLTHQGPMPVGEGAARAFMTHQGPMPVGEGAARALLTHRGPNAAPLLSSFPSSYHTGRSAS